MRTQFSIHSGPPAEAETYKSIRYVLTESAGVPYLQAWRGKARKSFANYRFRSVEHRAEYLARIKADEDASEVGRAQRKQTQAETVDKMANEIQAGTILHYSWGYEQTNAEYFQVIERFGKRGVVIREIGLKSIPGSEGFVSDRVLPDKDKFIGEPMRKQIGAYGVSFDHGTASPVHEWDAAYRSWYA